MACPYILQNKVGVPALCCSSQLDRMGERQTLACGEAGKPVGYPWVATFPDDANFYL